jgi:superfamily I DNA/RNA helicase
MDFRIADTFTDALARLPSQDQKAVKISVMDLQLDPTGPGLQMHRIDKSRDANFWSARVNRDIRLILHKTGSSLLVAWVGHHDEAYAWAERRRIETHPRTGAVQIVEVRERVEEAQPDLARIWSPAESPVFAVAEAPVPSFLFDALTSDQLMSIGVPEDWITPVLRTSEAGFFDLADHLPSEAAEALLQFATTGRLKTPELSFESETTPDPYQHPDARRRFATIETADDLRAALDAPWDKWSVFLHPSQRTVVERVYAGPARVAGSAGTGKTVVALHRAVRAVRSDPFARVLLATFSEPLAQHLESKLPVLIGADTALANRLTVTSFEGLGTELFQLAFGRKPRVASADQVDAALDEAASKAGLKGFSKRFLAVEWAQVVDARRVASADAYGTVPRLGRKTRLGSRQREALWPVFAAAALNLQEQALLTWSGVFHSLADHYGAKTEKPFSHVVVDEAQDLGVAELRLMCSIVPTEGADRLFFAGDLGQRIFQQPFSWKDLGADVRGRSSTLKVNYRTSQQIRESADGLLPPSVRDVDGREEDRRGTVSVFEGPAPDVWLAASVDEERDRIAAFVSTALADGIPAEQIGIFVRSRREIERARAAMELAATPLVEIGERQSGTSGSVSVGTMHLAKGLEFKAVAVMACDDDVLPSAERVDAIIDETDLDDVYETERHLLYVACTRARDRLLVTGVQPGSEFLADFGRRR